jgi:hypothetical protein
MNNCLLIWHCHSDNNSFFLFIFTFSLWCSFCYDLCAKSSVHWFITSFILVLCSVLLHPTNLQGPNKLEVETSGATEKATQRRSSSSGFLIEPSSAGKEMGARPPPTSQHVMMAAWNGVAPIEGRWRLMPWFPFSFLIGFYGPFWWAFLMQHLNIDSLDPFFVFLASVDLIWAPRS